MKIKKKTLREHDLFLFNVFLLVYYIIISQLLIIIF